VTASKVRYTFDNSGTNVVGTLNIHGWIYEMEVWGPADPPSVPDGGAPDGGASPGDGSTSALPVLTVPDTIIIDATEPGGAVVMYQATATDVEDGTLVPDCSPPAGTLFPIGETIVVCAVEDSAGQRVTASFSVRVIDGAGPVFTPVIGPIVAYAPSPAGVAVTYTTPTAIDAVDGPRPVQCTPASGSTFQLGMTTVTCAASDTHGNTAMMSFVVLVNLAIPDGEPCSIGPECAHGFCVDGVCCDTACGGGDPTDCQACWTAPGAPTNGTCAPLPGTHVCRESGGACDVEETCDNSRLDCPPDTFVDAETTCRQSVGICDAEEKCSGTSAQCPSDAFAPSTKPCRPFLSFCEPTIFCSGSPLCVVPPPPGNTCDSVPSGSNRDADLLDGGVLEVFFDTVNAPGGAISVEPAPPGLPPPSPSFRFAVDGESPNALLAWEIVNAVPFTGNATICFTYTSSQLSDAMEAFVKLVHYDEAAPCDDGHGVQTYWCPLGASNRTDLSQNRICGVTTSFSPFALLTPLSTPPFVTVPAAIVAGATSRAGAVVTFAATASDAEDGTLAPTCAPASGSTFPVGVTTVTCDVIDSSGVPAVAAFTVQVRYEAPTDGTFFLPPINADGSSIFKLGSTVPVKFQLSGASASISDLTARLSATKVSNGVTGTEIEAASNGAANDGNLFRYDAGARQYIFNLSTKPLSAGTWSLRAELGDGVPHAINVSLRK
jgi:hypothetical protein